MQGFDQLKEYEGVSNGETLISISLAGIGNETVAIQNSESIWMPGDVQFSGLDQILADLNVDQDVDYAKRAISSKILKNLSSVFSEHIDFFQKVNKSCESKSVVEIQKAGLFEKLDEMKALITAEATAKSITVFEEFTDFSIQYTNLFLAFDNHVDSVRKFLRYTNELQRLIVGLKEEKTKGLVNFSKERESNFNHNLDVFFTMTLLDFQKLPENVRLTEKIPQLFQRKYDDKDILATLLA